MALKRYIANRNMIITGDNDFDMYDLSMGSKISLKAGTYFVEADEEHPRQFEVDETVKVSPTSFFFRI